MSKNASTGRVLSLPVEPRPRRRARAARRSPSSDYLTTYRNDRGVHWIAVDLAAIQEILTAAVTASIEFSERLALVDLHAAIERGALRPFRYYAARWQWSDYRTRALFEREGLLSKRSSRSKRGAQEAHKRRTENDDSSAKKASGRTRGAQEAHSIDKTRLESKEIGAGAPSSSDSPSGKKSKPPRSPKTKAPKLTPADRAAELVAQLAFPAAYDTPEVRAEFTRWVEFRAYEHKKKPPGDLLKYFQDQLDDVDNAPPGGKYYIPGGVAGYVAALVVSRRTQWQHPYPDKDFNPSDGSPSGGSHKQPIQRLL